MKMIKGLLAAVLLTGVVGAANAVPTWVDYIDFNPDRKINDGQSFSYEHDITDEGFDPLVDWIDDYSLSVNLFDDNDSRREKATIKIPAFFWEDGSESYFNLSGQEFGGWTLLGWLQLSLTGELDVTVSSKSGDFFLGSSTLTVWGDDRHSVPEPGTLGLMGLALLGAGLGARRRKIAK